MAAVRSRDEVEAIVAHHPVALAAGPSLDTRRGRVDAAFLLTATTWRATLP
jgi:hypothetical protein